MAGCFRRNCEFCDEPIRMVEVEANMWRPYDNSGRHNCIRNQRRVASCRRPMSRAVVACMPSTPSVPVKRTPRIRVERDNEVIPIHFWIWLMIIISIPFSIDLTRISSQASE